MLSYVKLSMNDAYPIETAASVAAAAAVDPNGIKALLDSCLSIFFIKGNPVFCNGPESVPKNPPDCPIICNWVFDNFVLVDEPLAKPLGNFEISVLV